VANENADGSVEEDAENNSDGQDIEMKEAGSNGAATANPTVD